MSPRSLNRMIGLLLVGATVLSGCGGAARTTERPDVTATKHPNVPPPPPPAAPAAPAALPNEPDALVKMIEADGGKTQATEDALERLKMLAQSSSSRSLGALVDFVTLDVRTKQGRWGEVAGIYSADARRDPGNITAVSEMIKASAKDDKRVGENRILDFCFSLSREGLARTRQTIACARDALAAGAITMEKAKEMALPALGSLSDLRPEELARLAPKGMEIVDKIERCGTPTPLSYREVMDAYGEDGRTAAVYMRLAEAEDDAKKKYCYLGLAARACFDALHGAPECAEPRSLDLWLQKMKEVEPSRVEPAIKLLFQVKGQIYMELRGRETDPTRRALFNLHLALAHVCRANPSWRSRGEVFTVEYHVGRAAFFWSALYPGRSKPFPEALLDDGMKIILKRIKPVTSSRAPGPKGAYDDYE